ncbi:hypothetical protein LCGC14_1341200 [marine sediment metagenome]|uniref:Uncharacterized protein n=1 Tax=marine sediment metagenome TaxID=412755 RepID=A0A0F9L035_9ZZZZ
MPSGPKAPDSQQKTHGIITKAIGNVHKRGGTVPRSFTESQGRSLWLAAERTKAGRADTVAAGKYNKWQPTPADTAWQKREDKSLGPAVMPNVAKQKPLMPQTPKMMPKPPKAPKPIKPAGQRWI